MSMRSVGTDDGPPVPVKIGLQTAGVDDALAEIAALTPAARRAATRAQNKLAKWVGVHAARAIAQANQLPVKVIRDRVRLTRAKAGKPGKPGSGSVDQGSTVWIGTLTIPASKAGRVRQTRAGAAAGRHIYPDFFVATMPGGYTSVYQRHGAGQRWSKDRPRTSGPNLPIKESSITLEELEETRADLLRDGEDRYRALLVQELNFELNVKG